MPIRAFHDKLEESLHQQFQKLGFETFQLPYHETLSSDMVDILKNRWSPTALYIRGRADRLAIHKELPIEFEWEVKTHESRQHHDITLEALPLLHHIQKSVLGVECLYIHYNRHTERYSAFWVNNIPPVRVYLPLRWPQESEIHQFYKQILADGFRTNPIELTKVKGSGDPFIVIPQMWADDLPAWEELIEEKLTSCRQTQK